MTQITGISSNLALSQVESQSVSKSTQTVAAEEFAKVAESSIYVFLVSSLKLPEYESGISKSDLTATLKTMIADHSEEQDNSNQIDLLTNVIADFKSLSAGNDFITEESLTSSQGFKA
ncbi:MAG TPA: hypothetical protein PKI94_06705 [Candidatus Gastranaerophilaceae bacterium]|nr:hypothetical protein [Candidatus Gastranaerophilaceae bacterium]